MLEEMEEEVKKEEVGERGEEKKQGQRQSMAHKAKNNCYLTPYKEKFASC
jgi:hypothetical protein